MEQDNGKINNNINTNIISINFGEPENIIKKKKMAQMQNLLNTGLVVEHKILN